MNIGRLAQDNIQRFGEYKFVNYDGCWHTNVQLNSAAGKILRRELRKISSD